MKVSFLTLASSLSIIPWRASTRARTKVADCHPITKIGFLKTHKTGSSTIAVIKKPLSTNLKQLFAEYFVKIRSQTQFIDGSAARQEEKEHFSL